MLKTRQNAMDSEQSTLLSTTATFSLLERGDPARGGPKRKSPEQAGSNWGGADRKGPNENGGWFALALASALLVGSLAAGCQGTDSTESAADRKAALADTVQVLVQEWATAWSALKPEPYLDLYSEDVQFYYRGTRSPRRTFVKQVRSLMEGYQTYRIEPGDPQIDVLAENAAVASFRYKGQAVDTTGNARDVSAAVTLVYQRRDGDWKIIQVHESVPPPDESQ
jgi:uncharacterized protein (TIGR02246 family)